ncbi:MAG: TonB-dependent receptor [Bacteroides sp.]|nr:TonB-dependent receptor [Bacteroides sp.]MDD4055451.1 TonB-dependent receptor [Bacteroides sp.]MDD4720075.1 TonB-dependent receptor [Bacteroides sp.]NLI64583.1 TonB-dependent receptor [Bacteroidales bacterium]
MKKNRFKGLLFKRYLTALGFIFLFSFYGFAQSFSLTGTILDETGEAIIGANVLVKGTTSGTISDFDGAFSLPNVSIGSTIEVSFIGYEGQEITVKDRSPLQIILKEQQQFLDELIVVGYGVQKKSVVTAAISKVSSEELNAAKPSRVEDALKGKVSGVQITQSSGQPGTDSKVRIRGIGTVNNSEPLYIVDGMPVDGGINYLNPVDIESVEVLKDAASAAIYGARAANGVILVTTKSGKEGKPTINYNFSYGWQNPWRKKSVLNAQEYMVIMNETELNDGNKPRYSYDEISAVGKGTDWQDETFNYDAPIQNHQLSIQGGTDKIQYFLSLGYYDQEGIVGGNYGKSNYNRWSIRSNTTYTVYEANDRDWLNKVRVGLNLGYSRDKSTGIETNSEYGSILGSALTFNPIVPVYAPETSTNKDIYTISEILNKYEHAVRDKNGNVFSIPPQGFQEIANPVGMLNQPNKDKGNSDKFVGTFWGEVDLIPGLKFKSSYGFDLAFWGNDGYQFPYFLATMGKDVDQSSVWSSMNRGYKWQVENTLSYNTTLFDKHNIGVVLGQSGQKYTYRQIGGSNYDLLELDPGKANISSGIADPDDQRVYGGTGGYNFTSLASYFGRVDYNYDERYMIQATLRRDGSSRFGPDHKWATFPAVSLGWNILNEPYLTRPGWFDSFKLRFSWGRNGNENIGNFAYTSLMDGGQNYYFGGGYDVASESKDGIMQYGTSPARIPNPNIKWEESEQIDLGFDARFFNSALSFSFDYFKKKTNGMLMNLPIPSYVGQSAPIGNVGDMENWGLEFELGWKDNIKDFNYSILANASYLKNKLIKLGNASGEATYESGGASGVGSFVKGQNGEVWPYFYGYKTNGIFQNQAEIDAYVNEDGKKLQPTAQPGDVRFVDFNQDGTIDDNDKTKIGKGMPDWTYGLTLSADWRGIDLNLFFQGTLGNDIFDFSQRGDIPAMNRPSWILDRWHGEGTSNKIPRMTKSNPNGNWRSSDIYIKSGNYLRLKTAQLGYTLPRHWLSKASIQNLRVYVSAENLFTFTGYDGFDPEVASGGYTTIGIDRGVYPQARTISIGANLTF